MYSLDLLLEAALLCLSGSGLGSRSIKWVRVSSDIKLCSLRCDEDGIYTLDRDSSLPILDFACSDNSTNIYSDYQQRLSLNVSAGCCTIINAQPSDTGTYELSFYGKRKKKILVGATKYQVIDPVSVSTIMTNRSDSGETVSLSVSYSGEEATVLWTWNGGALPERHQLSDSNKTLTVPSTDTGTFTVLVSNPVSHTSTHYNLTLPEEALLRLRTGMIVSLVFISLFIGGVCWTQQKVHDMKIPACIKKCPPWSKLHGTKDGNQGAVSLSSPLYLL
ncbi:uncharacterized protein LOC108699066 isoform X1 [Xenopus laevis]|uniref:Uncharacterized protein LOC108699066 isoform X1 n=1 Tax=Xenopus laevis TaxID=8355 RepID=A0A8J1LIR7_XENLA|nr:uncharacterized protein LOC108699066 isoform X1 [Xenopus laevis]